MKNLVALVFGALLFTSSVNASALNNESVKSLMAEMNRIVGAMNKLGSKKAPLLALNVTINKTSKVWHKQVENQLPELKRQIGKLKTQVEGLKSFTEEKTRLDNWKDAIRGRCHGEVDGATYVRCMGEKKAVNEKITRNNMNKAILDEDKITIDKDMKKVTGIIGYYNALIIANSKEMTANFNRHVKIMLSIKRHMKTLRYYRGRLVDLCAAADAADTSRASNEALHYCQSMNWDGKSGTLPPLDVILRGTQFFGR